MEESIKYTIKYLLNDGILGCFVNSIVLNNRLDRICRELDSLGFESNVFGSYRLCGSNDEKDNPLLLRRRKGRKRRRGCLVKTRDDRYLTAEVGLGSMKASTPPTYSYRGRACKRAATYDSPSNEKIDRTERMESCWNREDSQDTFRSNDFNANFPTKISFKEPFDEDREKDGSTSLDPAKEHFKEHETIKRSTLKLIIRKARSLDCSCTISLKSIRSCSLSLPCKANDVTKEIFQADPGLHESCLIVMRRKFEMGIFNLCSCLNDVLEKISEKVIDLRLILEIRPGYIHFKLIGKEDRESRSCLFTDRVPICQSVHKRDVGRIIENPVDSNEVSYFNELYDSFNDAVASEENKNIDEGNCKKLWFSFPSQCPETNLNEVEQTLDGKVDMDEEQETQLLLDFSVNERTDKEKSINDDTVVLKKENDDVIEAVNSKLKINCYCKKSIDDFIKYSRMEANVSSSIALINDDTIELKRENGELPEDVKSKLEINCQCRKSVDDFMRYSMMEENVSSSVGRINDDTFVLKKKNDEVLEAVKSKLEINCQCKKSVDDLSRCSMIEERFESDREIKLDLTVECTCCSSCGTPIVSSNIDKEVNMSKSKNEILNLAKHLIIEIVEKINTMNAIEDTVTARSLKNEENSILVKEEYEESLSCDCSMSLDSLITRKTFHREEINSDCDSRCSCRTKVPSSISSSSLDRRSNEDFPSNAVLKNEDKFFSSIPSEIEKIDVSRTMNNSTIRLLDISKNENELVRSNYEEDKIICDRKDFISLSIQTSRTRTSSKFTNAKSWSGEICTRELQEDKMQKERKREKPLKIWKPYKKGSSRRRPMQILSEDKPQRTFLPTEKRSICTCNIPKRSGYPRRRRSKDDSWTSRIKKYISFRRSNFVSNSFCESFYSSRRSIGRLRNLVRTKLRRLMSSDGKNEKDRSKRKFPVYQKTDEVKRSRLVYDGRVQSCDDFFEFETLQPIYRKKRNDKKMMQQNSLDFFPRRTQHDVSIEKDKKKIPDRNLFFNLRSDRNVHRYSKEKRSMTYSYSNIDEKSFVREDNLIDTSSINKRLVRRKVESGKAREKLTDSERTFEFFFDKTFWEEITDHSGIVEEYEKSICDLGLDFRSKLEQYVSLCKNIKYSLIGSAKENDIGCK